MAARLGCLQRWLHPSATTGGAAVPDVLICWLDTCDHDLLCPCAGCASPASLTSFRTCSILSTGCFAALASGTTASRWKVYMLAPADAKSCRV